MLNRSLSSRLLAAAVLAFAACSVSAQGTGNVSGIPGLAGAPERVVTPAPKAAKSAGNFVTTPSGITIQLPAGMHPNSIGAQSFIAKAERERGATCTKRPCVPVTGRTADGKYPVYGLEGELGDLNYFSGNTVFRPNDLLGRMGYVSEADSHARGIQCDWICKNAAGQVIGLDPAYLKISQKK